MKFTKMSLVAALLVGSSAFAVDNIKVSGDANVFYGTNNASQGSAAGYRGISNAVTSANKGSLFSKDNSAADIGLNLNITADLAKNDYVSISAGAGYTVLSTLGLENNFVSNVWGAAHTAETSSGANYANVGAFGGARVNNANWVNEAWVAATAGKTTLKLGRMELDTPLAFTEKWSIEKNTFDAVVALNQDIPDTTLVAAWVGNGNGTENLGQNKQSNVQGLNLAAGPVVNKNGEFATYGTDGAYAAGIVNNSFKPLTVQAWYYNVLHVVDAYWLQADLNMEGILAGAQYTSGKLKDKGLGTATQADSDSVYALMLGYEMKDTMTIKVAYSSVNDNTRSLNANLGGFGFNTATATGASKLYTEAWWNYGYVVNTNTDSWKVSLESPVNGIFDLGVYYTQADQTDTSTGVDTGIDMKELTVTAGKSFGPLDATLAYIRTKADDLNIQPTDTKGKAFDAVQAYLTLNF